MGDMVDSKSDRTSLISAGVSDAKGAPYKQVHDDRKPSGGDNEISDLSINAAAHMRKNTLLRTLPLCLLTTPY